MRDIWGAHSDEYQDFSLLGYDAVQSGRKVPFWRNLGSFIIGIEPLFYPEDRGNRLLQMMVSF
jgi:hypothetical protein